MKITPKIVIPAIFILTTVAVATGTALSQDDPKPHVKGASTGVSSQNTTTSPTDTVTTPVDTPATTSTASHSSTGSKKPAATVASAPQQPAPVTTPTPTPTTPAPTPSFKIVFRPDDAYIWVVPYMDNTEQLITPFDIIFDAGFSGVPDMMPDCQFLITPTPEHNVLCNASIKDNGWLGVQYNDTSAAGHYKVEASYTIEGVTRTDTIEFDLS